MPAAAEPLFPLSIYDPSAAHYPIHGLAALLSKPVLSNSILKLYIGVLLICRDPVLC